MNIEFGENTTRLWWLIKNAIICENPPYIQKHGDSDEAILFLIFSRYIDNVVM